MDTKNHSLTVGPALQLRRTELRRLIYASGHVLGNWNRTAFQRVRDAIRSTFKEISDDRRNRLVFAELNRMSDHELADIGLSRSDLTLEGLAIAGSKRSSKQDLVANEIASLRTQREAMNRGD